MILKASQRGGARQLAQHLMRTDDNEHVEVHEVRGFVSEGLPGALNEAYAVSRGTRCEQFLFSVSLNPPENESVDVETFENALERIETRTGLSGQPRVVVFHEKEGRRHAHAVWSRIDTETMTARNLPHFKLKLRDISRELYIEHDWKMPRGLMNSAERDPRNFDLAEWQQAKRMGRDARDLKGMMQECWAVSDSRAAFAQALKERGLMLARGDRRGHVAVTHEGEVLSVARYTGKKAKEVRAKLGKPDSLPGVDQAQQKLARDMDSALARHLQEARSHHKREMVPLEVRRRAMTDQHGAERTKLEAGQEARWVAETRARSERLNSGLRGLWQRFTGERWRIQERNEREAYEALQRDRRQRQDLIEMQLRERQDLQGQIREQRGRYAELLAQLYRDRKRYREMDREPLDTVKSKFNRQERGFTQLAPEVTNQRTEITTTAPSAQDRLERLRSGRSRRRMGRDRGPELER